MTMIFVVIFLLCLSSLATAANFNQVFEWPDELDYEWPSEAKRSQALEDGTFKPEDMKPYFMAVCETRMFLSFYKHHVCIPVSLASLPTSSASSASPKFTPLPSWDMHEPGNCSKIIEAKGQKVDSMGRLWVLDSGSEHCSAKILTIDSANNDETKIIHQFPFYGSIHNLVLDETLKGTFAYITQLEEQHILVFSLERKESWTVDTPGMKVNSIALSPKEPTHLYLDIWDSTDLYSIPVAALRNRSRIANPILIGKWAAEPYSMLIDGQGIMYAVFLEKNYISSWITSQPFEEQHFHEFAVMNSERPFTFALDRNGTLWNLGFNATGQPKFWLSKVEVAAKSNKASRELSGATSGGEENVAENATGLHVIWIVILGGGVLLLFLVIALWLGYNYCPWFASLNCFGSSNSNQQSAVSGDDERSKNASTEVELTEVNRNDIS